MKVRWKSGDEGMLIIPGTICDGVAVTVTAINDQSVELEGSEGPVTLGLSALNYLWPSDASAPSAVH